MRKGRNRPLREAREQLREVIRRNRLMESRKVAAYCDAVQVATVMMLVCSMRRMGYAPCYAAVRPPRGIMRL
jgi:hypothetical protein